MMERHTPPTPSEDKDVLAGLQSVRRNSSALYL